MTTNFKEIFESVKNRNDESLKLEEAYNIGEAAKALKDTQNVLSSVAQDLAAGDFAKSFKQMHMDPRNLEDGVYELQKKLKLYKNQIDEQLKLLEDYLDEAHMYLNPESVNKDTHRQDYKRWNRWDRPQDRQ